MGTVNGLVLIKPTSFSFAGTAGSIPTGGQMAYTAVTSLIVDEIFSADYDEYLMIMSLVASANVDMFVRFRSYGQTLTSNLYTNQSSNDQYSDTTVTHARTVNGANIPAAVLGATNNSACLISMTFYDPYLPKKTSMRADSATGRLTNNVRQVQGTYNQAVFTDGLEISFTGGTVTGTATVYGVRK